MTNDNLSNGTDKSFDNSASSTTVNNRNEDNNISSRQEEALYYHSLNFNVIPIPKPGEKIAQVWSEEKQAFFDKIADGKSAKGYGSWNEWQSKQQTPEDISKLFNGKKDCNIAILTGKVSRIIAFDIDGEKAEKHFDKVVESLGDTETENAIKNTLQTKSGSGQGKHIIIRFNPEEFQNGKEIKTITLWIGEGNHSEIKLKAEGGYIIVPPSLHSSGNKYEFINKVEPLTFTKDQILKLISQFDTKTFGDGNGNMTEMKANILKQFNRGTLEIEMPIMCTTPAQVLESLSGMFGNATDIDGNATKQMMMMEMMQVQNMTEQELKEEMNALMCVPMTDENMTQSMIEGGMMQ